MSTTTTNLKLTKPALTDPADITNLNNNWDILDAKAKELTDGLNTATTKLDGIASGAEVNQNTFAKFKVGTTTITADAKQDTLTLVAGNNITLTPNATSDSITIAATAGNNYTLPKATSSTLGGVKVGNGLTVDSDGTLSATGTDVTIDNALSSSSTNPVQNKVIYDALSGKASTTHTHDNAEQWGSGFMSASDKQKLDSIQANANNYTLPTASSTKLGGVKVGSGLTISDGVLSATGTDVTIDSAISQTSTNPVQNKVVYSELSKKSDASHEHSNATQSANGYMSASDKTKLDGIATNANNYSLPTASSSTLGGVKIGTGLSISSGTVSLATASGTLGGVKTTSSVTSTSGLTACPIISGVPYYKDTNTTYSAATQSANGLMSSTDKKKLDGLIAYSYGTSDLTAGTTSLETGKLHFVYEA